MKITAVCIEENIACNKPATQSSIYANANASLAVDGNFSSIFYYGRSLFCSHTQELVVPAWLRINLIEKYYIDKVILLGRPEEIVSQRLDYFIISLSISDAAPDRGKYDLCGQFSSKAKVSVNMTLYCAYQRVPSQYIIVQQPKWFNGGALTVCELQAFGVIYQDLFDCPLGLYNKPICDKVCHCANGLPCHQGSGSCSNGCLKDWDGPACDRYLYNWKQNAKSMCYLDSFNVSIHIISDDKLTPSYCIDNCFNKGYIYAVLFNGNECHCSNEIINLNVTQSNCKTPCSGDSNKFCGGDLSNNYKQLFYVCPPNYFGYKCRFKCWCRTGTCNPDGTCIDDKSQCNDMWISPTCHIRNCVNDERCDNNGTCASRVINGGNYWYCKCNNGYKYENDTCTDIDECLNINSIKCNFQSQYCKNTIGNYSCHCRDGFEVNLLGGCNDIDECNNTYQCYFNETCMNTPGSYKCFVRKNENNNNSGTEKVIWPIIVGAIAGGILLISLILLILFFVRRLNVRSKTESTVKANISYHEHNTTELDSIDNIEDDTGSINNINAIMPEKIYSKVNKRDFEEEFNRLPKKPLRCFDYGRLKENRPKNRFKNITPYDDNRLKLKIQNGDQYSDYINATYITMIDGSKAIATQGPNPSAMNDFWRMAFECDVNVIVMLCNLKESDKVKCDQYWPSSGSQNYGDFEIEFQRATQWIDFIERKFLLKHQNDPGREITQYQFTGWPDHGIPDNITSLLALRNMARSQLNIDNRVPIIHCSAGVGRTGCFIAIDSLLEARKNGKNLKVFDCVNNMRVERQQMVQTLDQYKFIYTSLSTQIDLGEIVFSINKFLQIFNNRNINSDQQLKNQYKALTKETGKAKNSRFIKNSQNFQISSIFSDILFNFNNKLTPEIWTDNILNNLKQIILIATDQDSKNIIPSTESSIDTLRTTLRLKEAIQKSYGFLKILSMNVKTDQTYANLQANIYANASSDGFLSIHQITTMKAEKISFKDIQAVFESFRDEQLVITVFCVNIEMTCFFMAAFFAIQSVQKRDYISLFQILQQLYQNYKDFHITEAGYIQLHKFLLEYFNK